MSLVEAAKALATIEPIEDSDLGLRCMNCHASWRAIHPKHNPSCPWLALPKIVAALEAASVIADGSFSLDGYCTQCLTRVEDTDHERDCPWSTLRAALRGEP